MKYRKLGSTDLDVSVICLGCWQFGGKDYWGSQDEKDSIAAVMAAIESGVNLFDTAEDYGDGISSEVLGKALQGRRDEAIIASKISPKHLDWEQMQKACEEELRRLKTDRIDLYQIHWPSQQFDVAEALMQMERLKEQGKIRYIGIANFGPSFLSEVPPSTVVSHQLPYSLLWRAIEYEILPASQEKGLGILAYSSLYQGLLSGKFRSADEVPQGRQQTRLFSAYRPGATHGEPGCETEAFTAIEKIRQISAAMGESMADMSTAWVLAQKGITSAITGARNAGQVRENVRAAELELPTLTVQQLTAATEEVKQKIGSNADMWMHESRMDKQTVGAKS